MSATAHPQQAQHASEPYIKFFWLSPLSGSTMPSFAGVSVALGKVDFVGWGGGEELVGTFF